MKTTSHQTTEAEKGASRAASDFSRSMPHSAFAIMPKLEVGQPGDEYEREADRTADQVTQTTDNPSVQKATLPEEKVQKATLPEEKVQKETMPEEKVQKATLPEEKVQKETMPEEKVQKETLPEEKIQKKSVSGEKAAGIKHTPLNPPYRGDFTSNRQTSWIQRESWKRDDEDEPIQMKSVLPTNHEIPDQSWLENQISQSKNSGQPLPDGPRSFMESRLGADFSRVNIHTGNESAQLNRSLQAQAFTHGNDVYFNEGKYEPESRQGQHLLAHELTHVVQQTGSIQKMVSNPAKNNINFTDEILDIPFIQDNKEQNEMLEEVDSYSSSLSKEEESVINLQRAPDVIQGDDDVPKPARKDLVFLMGTKGGFYVAAKEFFKANHPEAEIVSFKDRSLAGIFAFLRKNISDEKPAGNIYIVSHANADGTLSFPIDSKDKDKNFTFGELKNTLVNNVEMFELAGGIDEQTSIHIKGCNIGRNAEMLNQIDKAFGGKVTVDAPTHKQGYEYRTKKVDGKTKKIAKESFDTLILEYPGDVQAVTDKLIKDFSDKYTDLGYEEYEWRMMVLGATNYNKEIDSQVKEEKKQIDDLAKETKKTIDKKDKDALKELEQEVKDQKKDVDDWANEMKTTKVAGKSKGAQRKVSNKFTATVYDDVNPNIDKKTALGYGRKWLRASLPAGFKVTECTSIAPNAVEHLKTDFKFLAENKKTGESRTGEVTTPELPVTYDDTARIANAIMDKTVTEKPEFEVSRRNMYSWRVEQKNEKTKILIKAFLETTSYSIDLPMMDKSGEKIDPESKTDKDFYFGMSDYS